ncbi:hypothetical protein FACS1894184_13540 [Clostridia bacterium]|nr:hypothetical protein FACS1894184_13540 [Clostridia bacterium]
MRYELVDTAYHQVIRLPFHIIYTFLPSKGTEHFAHRSAVFTRIYMRQGTRHLAKTIMEEFAISASRNPFMRFLIHAGQNLTQDDIYARHMHA